MSDILLYNAVVENQKLIKKFVNPSIPYDATYYSNNQLGVAYNCYGRTISQCPDMVKHWKRQLTPLTLPKAHGFKVCDSSGYFRCGASCGWGVPPGVTSVQFQLWGHGGGNSGQCCCGGTPFGPTGSYATACVPVTPGEGFSLYAGCAYCCYATQTTPGYNTNTTYVCSTTTTNFSLFANGAMPEFNNWCAAMLGVNSTQCGPPSNDGCGPSACSGWNFCWDASADNVCIPHAFSKCDTWCLCCNGRAGVITYGLPAIYPAIVIGCDLGSCGNSWHISAPVFGFENCTCCWSNSTIHTMGVMCHGYGGCGYSAQNGYQQIPAAGGFAGWVCGGYNAGSGDSGGMGMICVSWNCN